MIKKKTEDREREKERERPDPPTDLNVHAFYHPGGVVASSGLIAPVIDHYFN